MQNQIARSFAALALASLLSAGAAVGQAAAAALTFTPLPLINNWTTYNSATRVPTAALDSENIVHLRGAMRLNSGDNINPFILPPKFRPNKLVFVGISLINGRAGRLNIYPSGKVVIQAAGDIDDAFSFTSLEGVTYAKN